MDLNPIKVHSIKAPDDILNVFCFNQSSVIQNGMRFNRLNERKTGKAMEFGWILLFRIPRLQSLEVPISATSDDCSLVFIHGNRANGETETFNV